MKILIAVDGSECSTRAVQHVIRRCKACSGHEGFKVHVLTVQPPLRGNVGRFLDGHNVRDYHREEGMKGLAPARQLLDAEGVKYDHHIEVGQAADVIARYVVSHGIDEVIMGTRGLGNVADLLLGSTSEDVLRQVTVPVVLVK